MALTDPLQWVVTMIAAFGILILLGFAYIVLKILRTVNRVNRYLDEKRKDDFYRPDPQD